MKFTFNAAKYFYLLLWRTWKSSWFNKMLFVIIIFIGCLDLFTKKDLTGGIAFLVVIIVSYMMQKQELLEQKKELLDKLKDK